MAQELGNHPDAAAKRMRWIIQLTADMPIGRQGQPALATPAAEPEIRRKPAHGHSAQRPGFVRPAERDRTTQQREETT